MFLHNGFLQTSLYQKNTLFYIIARIYSLLQAATSIPCKKDRRYQSGDLFRKSRSAMQSGADFQRRYATGGFSRENNKKQTNQETPKGFLICHSKSSFIVF